MNCNCYRRKYLQRNKNGEIFIANVVPKIGKILNLPMLAIFHPNAAGISRKKQ